MWDWGSGGKVTERYYQKADGVVVVYSVTDRHSFLCVLDWVSEAQIHTPDAPILLLANKIDQPRQVAYCEGARLAGFLSVPFLEISVKTPTNVKQAFGLLCLLTTTNSTLSF